MNKSKIRIIALALLSQTITYTSTAQSDGTYDANYATKRVKIYKTVKLTTHTSHLNNEEKAALISFIDAAKIMDELFWKQAYGDRTKLDSLIESEEEHTFIDINYGPWDRLNNNKPFIKGIGEKPLGANFYPKDMTKKEFEKLNNKDKTSLYTLIKRNKKGELYVKQYHDEYVEQLEKAAMFLREAAHMLQENQTLFEYLMMRSEALITGNYDASDRKWLDLKDNKIEIILGPIENYEDKLFGYKAAYEAYVMVKDAEWTEKLKKYIKYLPELQTKLPVADKYKQEKPGGKSQLAVYDVVYYGGDNNAGSKTIAVNLPNDEKIQLEKGTKRSQLKNVMRAKFDHILMPLSQILMDKNQQKHITFNAFFSNTMFHEVAHGLGIKNTINNKGSVREALGANHSALEEGKADVLGLYMVSQLYRKKVLTEGELKDYYVTFVASIFRSVRFGAASSHGKANMIRFNYFIEKGAIVRNNKTGRYSVNMKKMDEAVKSLSQIILTLQGDGDTKGVEKLLGKYGKIGASLQKDLDGLTEQSIPVDIIFEQGVDVLNLFDENKNIDLLNPEEINK